MKILSVIIGMCLFEIYNFLYAKNNVYKIVFGSIVFILFCICIMFYLILNQEMLKKKAY